LIASAIDLTEIKNVDGENLDIQSISGKTFIGQNSNKSVYIRELVNHETVIMDFYGGDVDISESFISDDADRISFKFNSNFYTILETFNQSGIIFANGYFIYTPAQKKFYKNWENTVLNIGFLYDEKFVTYEEDWTLRENNRNSPNFASHGADRYSLNLELAALTDEELLSDKELSKRFVSGIIVKDGELLVGQKSEISQEMLDILAKRTYDESGSYSVRPWKVFLKDEENPYSYTASLQPGFGYIYGYPCENLKSLNFRVDRPYKSIEFERRSVLIDTGLYTPVLQNSNGTPQGNFLFEYTKAETIVLKTGINGTGETLGECICSGFGYLNDEIVIYLSETDQIANLFTAGKSFVSKANPTRYMNLKLSIADRSFFSGTYKTQIIETGIQNVNEIDLESVEYDFVKEFIATATDNVITLETSHEFDCFEEDSVIAIMNVATNSFVDIRELQCEVVDNTINLTSVYLTNGTYKVILRNHVVGANAMKTPKTEVVSYVYPTKNSGYQEDILYLSHEDIFSFVSVVQLDNTSSGEPLDITEYLVCDGGQGDEFYDVGTISGFLSEIVENYRVNKNIQTHYEITYRWFEHSGYGPFTADSYKNLKPLYTYSFVERFEEISGENITLDLKFPCYLNQENFAVFKSGLLLTPGTHYDRLDADGNVLPMVFNPDDVEFPEIAAIRVNAPNEISARISVVYFQSPSTRPVTTITVSETTDNLVVDVPVPVTQDQENFLVFKDGLLLIPGLNYDRLNEYGQLLPLTFTPGLYYYPTISKIRFQYTIEAGSNISFLRTLTKKRFDSSIIKHEVLDEDLNSFEIGTLAMTNIQNENFLVFRDGMLLFPGENYDRISPEDEVLPVVYDLQEDGGKTISKVRFDYLMPKYSEIALAKIDSNPPSLLEKDVVVWEYDFLYKSKTTGYFYYLKDCFDFRRKRSEATANSTNYLFPNSGYITSNGMYYLPRIDLVYVHKSGKFGYKYGIPSDPPGSPEWPVGSMGIALIYNFAINENNHDVFVLHYENQRYTMEDIGRIEKTVDNLSYAVALRQLELSIVKTTILDEEGNEYLKTGIFADNFNNFDMSDYSNPDWSATIDEYEYSMRPAINAVKIDFTYNEEESDTQIINSTVTTKWTVKEWISQKKRSSKINLQDYMFYIWQGNIVLDPSVDTWVDDEGEKIVSQTYTEVAMPPTIVAVGSYSSSSSSTRSSSSAGASTTRTEGDFLNTYQTTTTTTTTTTVTDTYRVDELRTYSDGGFVIDSRTSVNRSRAAEVMRQRSVSFHATGLRAGVVHRGYFDGEPISISNNTPDFVGVLNGTFTVPANVPVGTKIFSLADDEITSSASTEYTATGTIIWKDVTERYIRSWILTSSTTRSVLTGSSSSSRSSSSSSTAQISSVFIEPEPVPVVVVDDFWDDYLDPVAQSFYVENEEGIYLHSMDIFFAEKDPAVNVDLYILEMENGYPTSKALPFGKVSKTSAEVNVSGDDAVALPTKFIFSEPLYLYGQTEYAVMLKTTSYKYKVWKATLSETDIDSQIAIQEQPYVGSMFLSQNARTWTADQSSDIMFIAYRYDFDLKGSSFFEIINPDENVEVAFNSFVTNTFSPVGTAVKYHYIWENETDWTEYNNETTIRYSSLRNIWKTDDVEYSGKSSLRLRVDLTSESSFVSPQIDLEKNLGIFYNNVLRENPDPNFPWYGGAYISKTMNLNFDSENLRVYVNEILPNRSKIDFYVKYNDYTSLYVNQIAQTSGEYGWDTESPSEMIEKRAQIYHYNNVEKRFEPKSELIITGYDSENRKIFFRGIGNIEDLKNLVSGYTNIYQDLDEDFTGVFILNYLSGTNVQCDIYSDSESYQVGRFCFYSGNVWKTIRETSPGYIPYVGSPIWERIASAKIISKEKQDQDLSWRKLITTQNISSTSAGENFYEYMYEPENPDSSQFKLLSLKAEFFCKDKINVPRMKDLRLVSLV
jgi:hypothetical protein